MEGFSDIDFAADPVPWIILGLIAIPIGMITLAFLIKAQLGW